MSSTATSLHTIDNPMPGHYPRITTHHLGNRAWGSGGSVGCGTTIRCECGDLHDRYNDSPPSSADGKDWAEETYARHVLAAGGPTVERTLGLSSGDTIVRVSKRTVNMPGGAFAGYEDFMVYRVQNAAGRKLSYYRTNDGFTIEPVNGSLPWCIGGVRHRGPRLLTAPTVQRAAEIINSHRRSERSSTESTDT